MAGPSEFGLSVDFAATPDQVRRDGVSQSIVTVTQRGPDGKPVQGTLTVAYNGLGTVTADILTTGPDGRATFAVIAPPVTVAGDDIVIQLRPVGTNNSNSIGRNFTIGVFPSNPTPPTAAFTITPEAPIVGQTVVFNASGSTDGGASCANSCSFEWDFGDGEGGSGMIATHRYSSSGVKVVTLTVRDAIGAVSRSSQHLTVSALAPPVITVSPNPPVATESATFTAVATVPPGVVITRYNWNFGDGATSVSTSGTATHTYASPGAYTVTVTVEDSLGGSSDGILGVTAVAP